MKWLRDKTVFNFLIFNRCRKNLIFQKRIIFFNFRPKKFFYVCRIIQMVDYFFRFENYYIQIYSGKF